MCSLILARPGWLTCRTQQGLRHCTMQSGLGASRLSRWACSVRDSRLRMMPRKRHQQPLRQWYMLRGWPRACLVRGMLSLLSMQLLLCCSCDRRWLHMMLI
jgi:hypothetical protein